MDSFKIYLIDENVSIDCFDGESVVKAMSRFNPNHKMNGCNGGGCGVCKIKVHSGNFTFSKMSKAHISDEDIKNNVLLGCKVFPKSDMVIEYLKK